jgi:hypothetical protein
MAQLPTTATDCLNLLKVLTNQNVNGVDHLFLDHTYPHSITWQSVAHYVVELAEIEQKQQRPCSDEDYLKLRQVIACILTLYQDTVVSQQIAARHCPIYQATQPYVLPMDVLGCRTRLAGFLPFLIGFLRKLAARDAHNMNILNIFTYADGLVNLLAAICPADNDLRVVAAIYVQLYEQQHGLRLQQERANIIPANYATLAMMLRAKVENFIRKRHQQQQPPQQQQQQPPQQQQQQPPPQDINLTEIAKSFGSICL